MTVKKVTKKKNDPKAGRVTQQIVNQVRMEEANKKGKPPTPEEIAREKIRDIARHIVHCIDEVQDIRRLNTCLGNIELADCALQGTLDE